MDFKKSLIVLIVGVGLIAFSVFYFNNDSSVKYNSDQNIFSLSEAEDDSREVPDGWIEFSDEQYNLSLFHPAGMEFRKIDEGGGASTLVFEDIDKAEGFQIFIVPYSDSTVSEDRLRRDIPSGVIESPMDIELKGVPAKVFYSRHQLLGDTAEVWFIYNGHLYEMTTLRSLEEVLFNIVNTLKFLE